MKKGISLFLFIIITFCFCGCLSFKDTKTSNTSNNTKLETDHKVFQNIKIKNFNGKVFYGKLDNWKPLNTSIKFTEGLFFKTSEDSFLEILFSSENEIKLCSSSELKIEKETLIKLLDGEITASISVSGREKINIYASGINIVGQSGRFKVLYSKEKNQGEVVVKNGLAEVGYIDSKETTNKLTGFYKIVFNQDSLGSPTQVSMKNYDWK